MYSCINMFKTLVMYATLLYNGYNILVNKTINFYRPIFSIIISSILDLVSFFSRHFMEYCFGLIT